VAYFLANLYSIGEARAIVNWHFQNFSTDFDLIMGLRTSPISKLFHNTGSLLKISLCVASHAKLQLRYTTINVGGLYTLSQKMPSLISMRTMPNCKKSKKRSITVSEITNSLHRHCRRYGERMNEEIRLQTFLTMPTWRSAAECSTVGQQRPVKLDRRWLKKGCVGQQAMMSMQSYTSPVATTLSHVPVASRPASKK